MAERKTSSSNYFNQTFLENKCSLNELLNLVSKRWVCEVLFCIEEGHNRFSSIKENLEHISDHILSDRLRLLESYRLIYRQQYNAIPPRVEYFLTEQGMELSEQLDALCKFSDRLMLD
jgi:DNA-binding HxlR family transcriptional regulator